MYNPHLIICISSPKINKLFSQILTENFPVFMILILLTAIAYYNALNKMVYFSVNY